MLEVKKIEDLTIWDDFVQKQPYTLFVQSSAYPSFYETMGEQGWVFGLFENDILIGGSVVVTTHAKRGNFLYLPYGPVISGITPEKINTFFSFLKSFAKEKHFHFIRVSPFIENTPDVQAMFSAAGLRLAPIHVLAEHTWLLPLESDTTEDTIRMAMNKNHRNLIRRCEKEGVTVEMRRDKEAIHILNDMLDVTMKKHNFSRFPRKYIEQEFQALASRNQADIFLSYLPNGQVDAAAMIVFYGNMACYRHSASYYLDKHFPTSYFIQWRVIQEARRRNMNYYNFWGVAPQDAPKTHPFSGITHFKKGFGGFQIDLLPCHDIALSARYWITRSIETIRKIKRGF